MRTSLGIHWWCCLVLATAQACVSYSRPLLPYSMVLARATGGRLSFARCRGKVAMVDFFTTWSQASMVSIPGYAALYRKYADQGLCVMGVALDELIEAVEPFCQGMQVTYPVVLADEKIRKGKSSFGEFPIVPVLMVFDRRGLLSKVIAGHVSFLELEKILVPLLREMG